MELLLPGYRGTGGLREGLDYLKRTDLIETEITIGNVKYKIIVDEDSVVMWNDGSRYAGVDVDTITNQCGAILLHNFYSVSPEYMKPVIDRVLEVLTLFGYSNVFATQISQRVKTLVDCGFKELHKFTNKRTNSVVYYLTKDLE